MIGTDHKIKILFNCLFMISGPLEEIIEQHGVSPNDAKLIQVPFLVWPHF